VPFKDFVNSVALPESDLDTYLMRQTVIVCTSGTRPASPNEGMTIYETDTDRLLIYTTATTGWQPPWNLPWGRIAYASTTTSQTGIGPAVEDLTSLTVTFTAVANRKLRVTGNVMLAQETSTGFTAYVSITTGANAILQYAGRTFHNSGESDLFTPRLPEHSPAAGSTTYKLRGTCTASGVVQSVLSADNPAYIQVEDIGPNGAPA